MTLFPSDLENGIVKKNIIFHSSFIKKNKLMHSQDMLLSVENSLNSGFVGSSIGPCVSQFWYEKAAGCFVILAFGVDCL